MPLTIPAHQLFAIPLLGRARLPGAALMVGTVVPDVAFLVGGYPLSTPAHEPYGPLLLAPTLGIALYLYAELLLAPGLRATLPSRWARLFVTRGLPRTRSGWASVVGALLAGASTHVAVDGLTHHWMWPARELYPDVRVGPLRLTQVLQHSTSVLASIATVVWARRRLRPGVDDARWRRRLVIVLAAGLAGAIAGLGLGLALWGRPVVPHDYATLICPIADGAILAATLAMRPRAWSGRAGGAA